MIGPLANVWLDMVLGQSNMNKGLKWLVEYVHHVILVCYNKYQQGKLFRKSLISSLSRMQCQTQSRCNRSVLWGCSSFNKCACQRRRRRLYYLLGPFFLHYFSLTCGDYSLFLAFWFPPIYGSHVGWWLFFTLLSVMWCLRDVPINGTFTTKFN